MCVIGWLVERSLVGVGCVGLGEVVGEGKGVFAGMGLGAEGESEGWRSRLGAMFRDDEQAVWGLAGVSETDGAVRTVEGRGMVLR